MLVRLPSPDLLLGGEVPEGLEVQYWSGEERDPGRADEVACYVPPYLLGPAAYEALPAMTALRVVQTLTAGVDDVLPLLPAGVALHNAAGVHDASTAELAVGLVLASLRGIDDAARDMPAGRWRHTHRPALADRSVVVVGAGGVGRAVARRLAGFEADVTLVGRTARDGVVGADQLETLLPGADVLVLAVPLTDATHRLVDAPFLARLPDDALVVNVARGPVVDTDALLVELQRGRLRAALDVTDPEPLPPDHPLWRAPRCLVTPHVGGDTSAFLPRARALLSDQLVRFAQNLPLRNLVAVGGAG